MHEILVIYWDNNTVIDANRPRKFVVATYNTDTGCLLIYNVNAVDQTDACDKVFAEYATQTLNYDWKGTAHAIEEDKLHKLHRSHDQNLKLIEERLEKAKREYDYPAIGKLIMDLERYRRVAH